MPIEIKESKNLVLKTEFLGNETNDISHNSKDRFYLIDKDGNKLHYELQSTQQGIGDHFKGYLIAQTNIEPENTQALLASAKKYFAEHPEERATKGNTDTALVSDYAKILITEAANDSFRNRVYPNKEKQDGRHETNMEKLFLYQYSYLEQINKNRDDIKFLSWEQVTGKADFGGDMIKSSRENISQDTMNKKWKEEKTAFGEKWEESANRGEASLRERMKNDFNTSRKITVIKTDTRQTMHISNPDEQQEQTFNEDEKNALIRHAVLRNQNIAGK